MEECTFRPKINRTQPLGRRNGLQNISNNPGHYGRKGSLSDTRTGEGGEMEESRLSHSKRVRKFYEKQTGEKGRTREKRKGRSRSRSKSKTRKRSKLKERDAPGDRLFLEAEKRENRRMQRQREKRTREDKEIKQNLQKGRRLSKSKHRSD